MSTITSMDSELTLTDLFCGAGGSSTGAVQVPGVRVVTAMNHWDLALQTHNANHPNTLHVQADISQYDPRKVRRTRMLWGSPECTNHTVAKGKKRATNQPDFFGDTVPDEAAERSRATMWDMVRFAEWHQYDLIFTENVVDAARWMFFEEWLGCFHKLGYLHRIVYMNSMHAQHGGLPAPQSRDRMYVVFWKKGNRAPDFDRFLRPKAWCPNCDQLVDAVQSFKKAERWGRYKAQYVYRCPNMSCRNTVVEPAWLPAAEAIDWSLTGERIGDRARPLAPKTMDRIRAGLAKYGREIMSFDSVRGSQIITPVESEPFATQTTSYTRSLLIPMEGRDGKQAQPASDPLRTQTTRNETGLLVPYYGTANSATTNEPLRTVTGVDRFAMITTLRGTNAPKHVSQPLDTFAANGNHHGLTEWTVPDVDDCRFRMLEPHEIKRGMAFPEEYVMLGNKRVQVKMAGNAVCPPNSRDLIAMGAESLS